MLAAVIEQQNEKRFAPTFYMNVLRLVRVEATLKTKDSFADPRVRSSLNCVALSHCKNEGVPCQ